MPACVCVVCMHVCVNVNLRLCSVNTLRVCPLSLCVRILFVNACAYVRMRSVRWCAYACVCVVGACIVVINVCVRVCLFFFGV